MYDFKISNRFQSSYLEALKTTCNSGIVDRIQKPKDESLGQLSDLKIEIITGISLDSCLTNKSINHITSQYCVGLAECPNVSKFAFTSGNIPAPYNADV